MRRFVVTGPGPEMGLGAASERNGKLGMLLVSLLSLHRYKSPIGNVGALRTSSEQPHRDNSAMRTSSPGRECAVARRSGEESCSRGAGGGNTHWKLGR